jgi:riboflavin biosynthesis pyrimidine reductase
VRGLIAEGLPVAVELHPSDLAQWYAAPSVPWWRVNMVSTVDGAATGESGKSGSINNAADKAVFDALRASADVIVVGAGTARIEGYGPADRPTVLVSRSAEVPERLREAPAGSVLVATCESSPGLVAARQALGEEHVLVLGSHRVDLARLRTELVSRGWSQILGEGGPHLLRDLVAADVADELCVTTVPRLVSGGHPRISAGAPVDVPLRLHALLEAEGTLLARWLVGADEGLIAQPSSPRE